MQDNRPDEQQQDQPGLKVKIPLSIVRWLWYGVFILILSLPSLAYTGWLELIGRSLIIAQIASQLNAIINKK